MKNKILSVTACVSAVAASALYYYYFTKWVPVLFGVSAVLYALAAGCIAARFSEKKPLLKGIIAFALTCGGFFAVNFLVNNVIYKAVKAQTAAAIVSVITLLFFIVYYLLKSRKKEKNRLIAVLAFVLSIAATVCSMAPAQVQYFYRNSSKKVASPVAGREIAVKERELVNDADFYIAPDGDDANDGSFEHPFATFGKASAAKAISGRRIKTIAVKAGEYRVDSLEFSAVDGGTQDCPVTYTAYGDGEVIINGGVTLPGDSFKKVSDSKVLGRLAEGAKEKVLCVDLFSLGITPEQYGKIYTIGGYNTADKYDGDWTGDIYCELFINDKRQSLARYPNGRDYLYTGDVVFEGEGGSGHNGTKFEFETIRNPKPDVYKMDRELSDRIASWQTLDDVWMFGYWAYDWADASTPVGEVNHRNLTLSPKFVSRYVPKEGAPYYFFNVLEELDSPGEWYLDRENGVMYFYPPEDFSSSSSVELSLSTGNIIKSEADYMTFDGFTVKGTRGDAINITGNHNTVKNCVIKNVAGNALLMTGYDNLAFGNEITRTGKGGIILDGGDRETLTPGNNKAENNLVHDCSEIYETYQPAVTLNGVGNICAHNEMFNSPHEAITYSGNNHIIEYNLIHDVNLLTDDGGAIYAGRRWDFYGNVIRYNLIYDLGANGHKPVGIYMDDALAGQTIYGNIIINAPNYGLQLGGGQDLDVHDNIVINSYEPISFDDRALSGLVVNESNSFYQHFKKNGDLWKLLWDSPWESETWRKAYPQYERYSDDYSNTDSADFVLNPGHCTVTHNILISLRGTIGYIADTAYKYSKIENNALFKLSALNKIFVDPENGDYTLRDDAPVDFKIDVPAMSEFGRY
ncbi:MAG: right-handed parallel beta-helix repeat-containing protein [Clostridia bacterium]|nr:right-handed parallel beta-helix repeat-containing protein [Clostridia bacterium]